MFHWFVVDVQLGEKVQVFTDQVDVDLVSLSLVQRVETPLDAVGQVFLEDALKPLHSLPECQRLPVVANKLVGAPIEQSIRLNVIELPRYVLPDDLDRQDRVMLSLVLFALSLDQHSLNFEIVRQMTLHCLNLLLVDRKLSMYDLLQHVAGL